MIKKLLCYLFGHKYFVAAQKETGDSILGWIRCSRCDKEEYYQYDFPWS